ncbi:MAG: DUF4157 domain-containing protein [Acidobacteriota bacterium]
MRSYSEKAKAPAGPSREHRHLAQPGLVSRPIAGAGHSFSRVSVTNQELPAIQRRLTVGAPANAYEQEADRAAEVVTRKPALQAAGCSCGRSGGPEKVCAECAATPPSIQRKASGDPSPATAPSIINEVIQQPGRPLDGATRDFMESRFAHDFSQVRVHVDERAARSAQRIDADAYTVGRHVVFGPGRFQPASADGSRLLAHELTHVVQQGAAGASSRVPGTVQRQTAKVPEDNDAARIRDNKIIYTCNCGWIDKTHATDTTSHPDVGAHSLWKKILQETGTSVDENWYLLNYRQDAVVKGKLGGRTSLLNVPSQSGSIIPGAPAISLPGIDWSVDLPEVGLRLHPGKMGHYQVKRGLSIEQKKSVALAIFQEVSRSFEDFQSWGWVIGRGSSSFSEEDLVSNLIGFYSAVESIPFEEYLELCAPVGKEDSKAVLTEHGAPGTKKNKSFKPVLYPCKACAAAGVFPAEFQTIEPAEEGSLYKKIDVSTTLTR